MKFAEHDSVVLTRDLPGEGLRAGAVGAVVRVHGEGVAYEVEFFCQAETLAVATVYASDLRLRDPIDGPAGCVDELWPGSTGTWAIVCTSGSYLVLDLKHMTLTRHPGDGARMPEDELERPIRWILAWPKLGERARFRLEDGGRLTCTETKQIQIIEAFEEERS